MNKEISMESKVEKYVPEGYDVDLYKIRHSVAHVMAQAVSEHFPEAKIAIGPPIEDGFYYDFVLSHTPTEEDLKQIENRMKEILRGRHRFQVREVTPEEARELFQDQPYKLEIIEGILQEQYNRDEDESPERNYPTITTYQHDTFVDLCRGPHVEHTGKIKANAFKLMNAAGAYWRGDEKNEMLTRIYGTAWRNKTELDQYLERLEEAKRRDHRRLGRDLELFAMHDLVGASLPLWLPKGSVVRRCLEEYITEEERRAGYMHVYTPHLGKKELYETSGHWHHYKDDMFPTIKLEQEDMVLRPMNCPHHILCYTLKPRSYRDLPQRIAELGTMYRYERSGTVSGLHRVRAMTLNDAHIFCTPDQVKEEFANVMRLVERAYSTLGITDYHYRLSLRDPADREKYADNDPMWEMAERVLREAMDNLHLPYTEAPGEAAFYGPKLDIQFRDVYGREETYSTIQIDFHLPNQFDLTYIGEDGREHRPVIIHRGVIGTMERLMAYLIELYAGAFPVWLAPVQAVLISVSDRHLNYARQVSSQLTSADFRVEVDESDKWLKAKIREAQLQKIPYILVVGDKEIEKGTVAVRLRTGEDLGEKPISEFKELLRTIVKQKSLSLVD